MGESAATEEPVRKHMGDARDVEMVARLISLEGLAVVDVGCGAGDKSRQLAARGASVLGVEPDPVQAARNALAPASANLTFVDARA